MVGRHAMILQNYDEKLSESKIIFDRMDIWVYILNLPLGWMNHTKGFWLMSLLGRLVKMDVDSGRKVKGPKWLEEVNSL